MGKITSGIRKITAAAVLFTAIILPVGIFSPFTVSDYMAAGAQPPSIGKTLLWLIPLEVLLLGLVFLLDPKKRNRS
ncbi:MAG: hypothetical protein KQH63_21025 [Desulfobulbaceae bacterium]|nr:hypothetical protein [Desulfobulbaceae bacterium]